MINLIPPYARKQVKIEYWVRVISVWLFLLTFAFLIIGFLLVPSLVLIRSELLAYDDTYQSATEQNEAYLALENKLISANAIASKLVDSDNNTLFTKIISELGSVIDENVALESISFTREDGKVEAVVITGNAGSRVSLVSFRDNLEDSSLFASAEIPLSDLARDKDIPFKITIVTSNEIYK